MFFNYQKQSFCETREQDCLFWIPPVENQTIIFYSNLSAWRKDFETKMCFIKGAKAHLPTVGCVESADRQWAAKPT